MAHNYGRDGECTGRCSPKARTAHGPHQKYGAMKHFVMPHVPRHPLRGAIGLFAVVAGAAFGAVTPALADVGSDLLGPAPPGTSLPGSQKNFEEYAPYDDGALSGGASQPGAPQSGPSPMNLERWQISTGSGYITAG